MRRTDWKGYGLALLNCIESQFAVTAIFIIIVLSVRRARAHPDSLNVAWSIEVEKLTLRDAMRCLQPL